VKKGEAEHCKGAKRVPEKRERQFDAERGGEYRKEDV